MDQNRPVVVGYIGKHGSTNKAMCEGSPLASIDNGARMEGHDIDCSSMAHNSVPLAADKLEGDFDR